MRSLVVWHEANNELAACKTLARIASGVPEARPDQGNYGQGDVYDDGLTKLERVQIEQGREAYLTGGAKLRYKRLTGQI